MERQGGLLSPEGGVGYGWQAQDLHPAGVAGHAAAADAARGREEVERAAHVPVRIREVADTPMEILTQHTAFAPVRHL